MKSSRIPWVVAALASVAFFAAAAHAGSLSESGAQPVEFSVLGGVQMLNQNDTAIPDHSFNIPLVADVTYRLSSNWAVEGDFTWMIPVKQKVDLGSGIQQDRKAPDLLAYQAGVRASLPASSWTPYLAAGAGAVTFLSSTDADRAPQLDQSKTVFAINFGGGADYALSGSWGLRADVRELVAFPSSSDAGLSTAGQADAIWMSRAAVGLDYRF